MKPIKVLVVDDDMILRELVATILELNGYEAKSVINGEEAIKTLDQEAFHAVITDLKMGRVDGHAVVRHAKRIHPETLLIMMTGYCDENSKQQAFDNGADHFMCKPVVMKELLRKLPAPEGTVNLGTVGFTGIYSR